LTKRKPHTKRVSHKEIAMVTNWPVSRISGFDENGDGVFESQAHGGGPVGMLVAAPGFAATSEIRCSVVFDLEGIDRSFVWANLAFQGSIEQNGGSYEIHGFRSGPTATLSDLTISNRLWGPGRPTVFFPDPEGPSRTSQNLDVGPFLRSQLALGARYVGFSIRNVGSVGATIVWGAVLTVLTPWALPLAYLPGLTVELRPPKPWVSDIPRLVAEVQARVGQREGNASTPAPPMAQLLQAVLIRELAASMTEPGARSIQKQALEMIGRIAADEITQLSPENS
jgi:hypothetical protein